MRLDPGEIRTVHRVRLAVPRVPLHLGGHLHFFSGRPSVHNPLRLLGYVVNLVERRPSGDGNDCRIQKNTPAGEISAEIELEVLWTVALAIFRGWWRKMDSD